MKSALRVSQTGLQGLLLATMVLACALSQPLEALSGEPGTDRFQWADMLEQAAGKIDAASVPDFDQVTGETVLAIEQVGKDLNSEFGDSLAGQWLDYLQMGPLRDAIEQLGDVKSKPSTRAEASTMAKRLRLLSDAIDKLLARLTINYPGLEHPSIAMLRGQVRRLDAMVRHRDPERSVRYLKRQMESLAESLRSEPEMGNSDAYFRLDSLVRLLDETGQADELISVLRRYYSQPNLRLHAGANLINELSARPLCEPSDVDECMFGTRVLGKAVLDGHISARLMPSSGTAKIQLLLQGTVTSDNRGFRFPVTVDAKGLGHVTATKVINVSDSGFDAEPAIAQATMTSRIRRINHPLNIVRRLAWREAEKQKPRSNAEGARRLERRVEADFDRKTEESNPLGESTPVKDLATVLSRFGIDAPERTWSSDHQYISATILQHSGVTLAADVPARPITQSHQLSVQIHESLVNNVTTTLFGNRTVSTKQIDHVIKSILPGFESEEESQEKVRIAFARTRPVIFEARDGVFRIGIRGTQFTQGQQTLDMNLQVTAEYQPENVNGVVILRRIGEIEIVFPGTKRLSFGQIATRKKMEAVFGRVFPHQLLDGPIELPLKQDAPTKVHSRELTVQQGWLTIGLR